ncbi:hypothetical protein [Trinickia diaoshuihuensis]|uniref:hypothetical protein n=1 Tax=Trinickia diaoshuihuensis TaxID=2292265 RepID=UPI0013C36763|nr:hypothetical protein [Trinickia diaoshuihuensis]
MNIDLDNKSINAVYANGKNEIKVTTQYEISLIASGEDAKTQNSATVELINFLNGQKIPSYNPTDIPPGTATGWKYWTEAGKYVNPFSPPAGTNFVESGDIQSTSSPVDTTGPQYRYFWLYNDSGVNDPLSVAMSVSWTDPDGNPWTFTTAQSNSNSAASVAVTAVSPKIYGIGNTNGDNLDHKSTASGTLDSGPSWYQTNYFFRIKDANFYIKDATITSNPDTEQKSPFAIIQDHDTCFLYYAWDLGAADTATISPLNISVDYNERQGQLCITQIMVPFDYSETACFNNTTATILDNYANGTTFNITIVDSGRTPQFTNNN